MHLTPIRPSGGKICKLKLLPPPPLSLPSTTRRICQSHFASSSSRAEIGTAHRVRPSVTDNRKYLASDEDFKFECRKCMHRSLASACETSRRQRQKSKDVREKIRAKLNNRLLRGCIKLILVAGTGMLDAARQGMIFMQPLGEKRNQCLISY